MQESLTPFLMSLYMRRKLFIVIIIMLAAVSTRAQSPDDFYFQSIASEQSALPYPFLRESDIVWSTMLWKTIDLNELFNQFFYYPIENPDPSGKKSLAYTLWDAMAAGIIPVFEDDELKIPIDNELFVRRYTKPDTLLLEIGYDDDDNEEYQTIIRPHEFDGAEIFQYSIREVWFIGKQDTRQDSRRLALAPLKQSFHKFANTEEEIYLGLLPLFWVPMQNAHVRQLLSQSTAYTDRNNLVGQPSWDAVFVSQHYNAYITRESNRYLRTVSQYLTGEDALLESDRIEEKVFDIESDMWEY